MSIDINVFNYLILHLVNITTHEMRTFDDVLLFSIKSKMLKITRKENSFGINLSLTYFLARLTPPVCLYSHFCLFGAGVGEAS